MSEPSAPAASEAKTTGISFKDLRDAAIKKNAAPDNKTSAAASESKPYDAAKTGTAAPQENAAEAAESKQEAEQKANETTNNEEESDFSMCCDSLINSILSGIVGILEGFGLLNEKTGNDVLPEQVKEMILNAISNAVDTVVTDDTAAAQGQNTGAENKFSELIARMPQNDQTKLKAQTKIEDLVKEYLSSFANVNNKGANKTVPANEGVKPDSMKVQVNLQGLMDSMEYKPGINDGQDGEKLQELLNSIKQQLKQGPESQNTQEKPQNIMDKLLQMVQEAYSKNTDSQNTGEDTPKNQAAVKGDAIKPDETAVSGFKPLQETQVKNTETILQAEAKPQTPNTVQDNMERIIQKMTASVQEGKQQFEIALKPEYLGKLSIKLVMDNDGIKAHIKASDTSVKGMIADQLPALQEALKEKGITVTHIEVTYERPAFDSQQSHQQNWQNNSGKKAIRYAIADLGGIAYQTMPDASELFIRNSSVEFQA